MTLSRVLDKKVYQNDLKNNKFNKYDIVGKYVTVVFTPNAFEIDITGACVYETRYMLYLEVKDGLKKIAKAYRIFKLVENQNIIYIRGGEINKDIYKRSYISR